MRISIFGLGYVGAVSCGCLADLGHEVIGCDVSQAKVDLINAGKPPIVEDGLDVLLQNAIKSKKLRATIDPEEAVRNSDVALVCVGTPSTRSGGVNSVYLETVAAQIGEIVRKLNLPQFVVMTRSTSLPHVHAQMIAILEKTTGRAMGKGIGYVCHPEFLREGIAVEDFYNPPKVVFGATDAVTEALCRRMYPESIKAPTFFVKPDVAAMIKYADNCFHALKVTFGNEIGMMCKVLGVDSHAVMDVFCADQKLNISPKYLKPGFAYGGSCLPKDLRAICDKARETATPVPMLGGMLQSNKDQIDQLIKRVVSESRPKVGVIGLAFKEGTDDVRESPIVACVEVFCGKGHPVKVYDEHLSPQALVGANRSFAFQAVPHLSELMCGKLQEVVDWADVLVVTHRLKPETWAAVKWKPGQRVLDLVNIAGLRAAPGYDGLYW